MDHDFLGVFGLFGVKSHEHGLIEALVNNQEYRLALLLGLSLTDQPPLETLLKAAYQLQWWQSYQNLLAQLPLVEQAFWQGLKAQAEGNYPAALKFWKTDWPTWSEQLLTGSDLAEKISTSCGKQQAENYQHWLNWQNKQPGSKHWQAASGHIKDYAGADTIYSPERDLYSKGFRTNTEQPIRISLLGPRLLKLKIRPLHPDKQADSSLNGWIEILDNQQHLHYPFSNNSPSQGLELISGKDLQLGSLVELQYQLGAGWHDIQVFSQQALLSVNLDEAQAQMPVEVLPRLTAYNFTATWQLPELPMLTLDTLPLINPTRDEFIANLHAQHLSTTQHSQHQPDTSSFKNCQTLKPVDLSSTLKALPGNPSKALMIAAEKLSVSEVLSLPEVLNLEQAQLRMMHYLRLVESAAPNIEKLLFPAEQLRLTYLHDPLLQSLWQRISQYSQWQDVDTVEANAGFRFIKITGWQPESPFIRVRKALLSYTSDNEQIIFADQRLVLFTHNLAATSLVINTRLGDVPFLPEADAKLWYAIDKQPPQSLSLKREQNWQSFKIKLPAGEHSLRFYQRKALGNQFIRLRFDQQISQSNFVRERGYFISTPEEPVRIDILGPARLRIDEWVNVGGNVGDSGQSQSRYLNIAPGWQELSLPPSSELKESLLRFKTRRLVFKAKKINKRIIPRQLEKIPAPKINIATAQKAKKVYLNDAFQLGKQEDGTWSNGFDIVHRYNVQEDSADEFAEQFVQYRLQHHYYQPYLKSYTGIEGFARLREFGSPTLGIKYSQNFLASTLPLYINFDSQLIAQNVEDKLEWSGLLKLNATKSYPLLPKTKLIPSVSLFARYLSLKNLPFAQEDADFYKKIDKDVYSSYKADHLSGLNTALSLEHRPWLDSLWKVRIKLGSNENFNLFDPDHIRTQFHWKQLFGTVKLDAAYKKTFYRADSDRSKNSQRSQINLDLDWDHWRSSRQRIQLSSDYIYDIEKHHNSFMFSVTFHLNEGRGYRDFKPGSLDFKHLMQRQIPDEENNSIKYAY